MKKIFTLLVTASFGTLAFGQTVFQSDLSTWGSPPAVVPTDWMGPHSSITAGNVAQQSVGVSFGTFSASLVNSTSSHKRFTTQPATVVPGQTYEIKMWVSSLMGDLRTNYYDVTNGNYGSYNSYMDMATLSAGSQVILTQSVTMPAGCTSAEFILSLRNTDPLTSGPPLQLGIVIDSVNISVAAAPVALVKTIHDIQFTTATSGDSPYKDSLVETSGVVTAVQYNGYYLQDGNGAWDGIFVLDYTNTPTMADNVSITGTVDEYFDYTTIKNISVYNATSGGTVPAATSITTLAANDEQYEGVLVKVTNATCNSDTTSNAFREWTINDGSGDIVVDDKMYVFGPTLTSKYDVTGVLDYSFGNAKLIPRNAGDVSLATGINEFSNVNISVYPNPVKNILNFKLDINAFNVVIVDVTGKMIKAASTLSNKLAVSTSNFNNGIYFYTVSDVNGNLITTNKFVVVK